MKSTLLSMNPNSAIYIAGPMTGKPEWNYPKFFKIERELNNLGYQNILNPASNPKDPEKTPWSEFIQDALQMVIRSNALVFMDDWTQSRGARIEMAVARALGLPTFDEQYNEFYTSVSIHTPEGQQLSNETVCQEADRIVSSDRGNDYGHPFDDFSKTGKIWGAVLNDWKKSPDLADVPPELVALCMVGVKISRQTNRHKRDNLVDGCGYFKTAELVMERKAELQKASTKPSEQIE
jgi:hypothetical protein